MKHISTTERKKSIMNFAGRLEGKGNWKDLYKEILELRKKSKFREAKF